MVVFGMQKPNLKGWEGSIKFIPQANWYMYIYFRTSERTYNVQESDSAVINVNIHICTVGLLMSLPEGAETLQNNIAQLCELW